jgi:hypothetical protein
MPIMFGQVGAPSNISAADSSNLPALQGKAGELVVTELHGKWYTEAYRGHVFSASTAIAGSAVGTATSTNLTSLTLWNPLGSGVNLELISVDVNVLATIGIGGLALSYATGIGANAGTGAPVISLTAVTPINANIGATQTSLAKAASALSLTTAPVLFTNLGISTQSSTAGTGAYLTRIDVDGKIVVAPGSAITLVAGAATTAAASFFWAEIPV